MKARIENIEQGFINWFTNEIATLDWKMALATPLVRMSINNYITKNQTIINALRDADGLIDVGTLHKDYAAIINAKGSIEISGVKLTTKDLDTLMGYINNATPPQQIPKVVEGGVSNGS